MNKFLSIILVAVFLFLPVNQLIAQEVIEDGQQIEIEAELPNVSILPDSPLYVFKRLGEWVGDWLTFGDEKQLNRNLEIAKTRLAESQALINKGNIETAQFAIKSYLERIDDTGLSLKNLSERLPNTEESLALLNNFEGSLVQQQVWLERFRDQVDIEKWQQWQEALVENQTWQAVVKEISVQSQSAWEEVKENIGNLSSIREQVQRDLQLKLETIE